MPHATTGIMRRIALALAPVLLCWSAPVAAQGFSPTTDYSDFFGWGIDGGVRVGGRWSLSGRRDSFGMEVDLAVRIPIIDFGSFGLLATVGPELALQPQRFDTALERRSDAWAVGPAVAVALMHDIGRISVRFGVGGGQYGAGVELLKWRQSIEIATRYPLEYALLGVAVVFDQTRREDTEQWERGVSLLGTVTVQSPVF